MAYLESRRRALFEKDCGRLIKLVTDFEEDEENFGICLDFMLSNLLFHSYPDVDSHKVKRIITGLYEKFQIHADLSKAADFFVVSQKLLDIFDRKYGSEKEQGYGILALLLHLNESNTSYQFRPEFQISKRDINDNIDWGTYLKEDDIKCDYTSSSSSGSEVFSSDEEVDDVCDGFLRLPPRDDSGLGISPDSCSGGSQQQFHVSSVCMPSSPDYVDTSLQSESQNSFYPYWIPKYQQVYSSSPYDLPSVHFTKAWEEHVANQNLFAVIERKTVMHERNVVKEVLWMLSGIKNLFLFEWKNDKFVVNTNIHLSSLTSFSLAIVLNEFAEYGTKKAILQSFVDGLLLGSDSQSSCLTYEAYASALQEQLQNINDSLCELEKTLIKRSETLTLLVLQEKVKNSLNDIDVLCYIHEEISSHLLKNTSHHEKSCKMLHSLWKLMLCQSLKDQASSSLNIILKTFLRACVPLFTFIENLVFHSTFKDIYGEFLFIRTVDVQVTAEEFWENAFVLRHLPSDTESDFFLKPFLNEIVTAAKSLEILNKMNSLQRKEPIRLNVEKGELYSKFLHVLQRSITKTHQTTVSKKNQIKPTCQANFVHKDPMLEQSIFQFQKSTEKFFRPNINPVYVPITKKPSEEIFTPSQWKAHEVLQHLEPKSLKIKTLNKSITDALDISMKFACYSPCSKLMKALKEEYSVMTHMNVMKKYFLMEAGDLMFSFYSKVFEKIFYNEPWKDVSFLYSVLQNAISEDNENCESLGVFYDFQNSEIQMSQPLSSLNALQLNYKVEWPVSIMLGSRIQMQYRQIFSFLLQIKCAKYMLDELHFTRLYEKEPQNKLGKLLSRSIYPKEQKIHGMYVIRMRLMYFVNGLHNYIMTRILHSFGLEFSEKLRNAKTVDEMIVAHNSYLKSLHERCLLDRRLPHLKEQIFQVLNLCYNFKQLWLKGMDKISFEDLQNIEVQFSNYNNFLFSYLNAPLKRGAYFHLESLVNTMLSETHKFHVFKETEFPSSFWK